jgi:hypothetical protein
MSLNKFSQKPVTKKLAAPVPSHASAYHASMLAQASRVPRLRPVQVATKKGPLGGKISVTKGIKR